MPLKTKTILFNIILGVIAFIMIIPFLWMLMSSFTPNSEIVKIGGSIIPSVFNFDNYVNAQKNFNFMGMFFNSMFISIAITLIIIYTSTISGFVFAKYKFRGNNILFGIILSTMMIPWCVTILSKYDMIVNLGWLDSYTGLIVPSMVSGFGIFMMRQAISGIPDEILEAARIDGASEWYIFHRIIFPMSRNAVSSIAIFQFLWVWEDYLWPYLVINSDSKQLLSVGLKMFNGQYGTDYGGLFAATTVSILPVVIIYIIFQKRFIAGVASGSIK